MTRRRSSLRREVFLSHSSRDHAFAKRITEDIQRHGVPIWFGPSNIRGAQQWHDEIGEALDRCKWFVLVLSPNAVKSEWVKRELVYALNSPRYRNCIIPVLHKKCNVLKLSWTLGSIQQIDFTSDYHTGCQELFKIWGMTYQPAPRPARETGRLQTRHRGRGRSRK